jgi:hypothetical protein
MMKKLILVLMAMLTLSSVSANNELFSFCNGMTFDRDKNTCLGIIREGTYQSEMIAQCKRMTFDNDKLSCIRSIKDKFYQPEGINFCQSMTFDRDKKTCYQIIENKSLYVEMVNSCRSMTFDNDKLFCLRSNAVAGEYYDNSLSSEELLQMIGDIAVRVRRNIERGNFRRALDGVIRIINLTSQY